MSYTTDLRYCEASGTSTGEMYLIKTSGKKEKKTSNDPKGQVLKSLGKIYEGDEFVVERSKSYLNALMSKSYRRSVAGCVHKG